MICPAGKIATTVTGGTVDKLDGCSLCQPGTFSAGGSDTSYAQLATVIAPKTGSITNIDGCEECPSVVYSGGEEKTTKCLLKN